MTTFAIDTDNNITASPAAGQIPEGQEHFTSEKDLAKLAASWPSERLVQIWNGFAGVTPFDDLKPVKKFTGRKTAVARIWRAIQRLAPAATETAPGAPLGALDAPKTKGPKKKATAAKKAGPARKGGKQPRKGSKKAQVIELLQRPEGATLAEVMRATGWQAHTCRGFLSTLPNKVPIEISSSKGEDGARV